MLIVTTPVLLAAYFETGAAALQAAMYGLCLVAVLPHIGPFGASLPRNPANLLFVLLIGLLTLSMAAALGRSPSPYTGLQAKALAATAVWTSIYVVVFSSLRSRDGILRLIRWINAACLLITVSVYASVLAHAVGFSFGEVLQYRDGAIRAFGPLGDQVGFVLVLPALTSLAAPNPLMFGVHLGALFLTATRGSFFCFILGVAGYALFLVSGGAQTRGRVRWAVAAAAVAGAVWLSPVSDTLRARLQQPSTASGYVFRVASIEGGAKVFRENPLLGVGFNALSDRRSAVVEDWLTPEIAERGLARAANQFVQTAADGGVPALLTLVLFVCWTVRNAVRVARWREGTAELAALQIWLVSVLVGNVGALWFQSSTATGFLVFAVAGMTSKVSAVIEQSRRSVPAFSVGAAFEPAGALTAQHLERTPDHHERLARVRP